jgi:DNA replication protein DnaC
MKSANEKQSCPLCGGSGWTVRTNTQGREQAVRCECRLGSWADRLVTAANIPKRYEHCTFSNFDADFDGAHPSLAKARFVAGRFVEDYPVETVGLMLVGDSGRGKTHLAVGVIKELMLEKRVSCLFCDYRELLKNIQDSYNPNVSATELGILRPIFEAEVLLLDDLGAVRPTEWIWDTVSLVLNNRYNESKTTIITTNFDDEPGGSESEEPPPGRRKPAALKDTLGDRIGNRMLSRLHEMCRIIRMEGKDFRQTVRKAVDVERQRGISGR